MERPALQVAIIGAGLSGLALALALHQQRISCSIYEARDAPLDIGGGLFLTPNGLKVMKTLGIYESLKIQSYNFDRIYFQDGNNGSILESIEFGNIERYGFPALRIYRSTVLKELLAQVRKKGIPIHFGCRFTQIVSETEDAVTWQFNHDTNATASLLIGADGIHSTVRQYLAPDSKPAFASIAAIVAAIPTAQLELPEDDLKDLNARSNKHPIPGGIIVPKLGAFIIAPQSLSGDEVMITVSRPMEEPSSGRWTDIDANKDALIALFRQNSERFPVVVQNAVRNIPHESLKLWPFYKVPRLGSWTSTGTHGGHGRVAILGDSAHAVPPQAGQGVNQAFEDVYTFALILGQLCHEGSNERPAKERLKWALHGWQAVRQARVDRVMELNHQMDIRRMPTAPDVPAPEMEPLDEAFDWLFKVDYDAAVTECFAKAALY